MQYRGKRKTSEAGRSNNNSYILNAWKILLVVVLQLGFKIGITLSRIYFIFEEN
jgi:hypothetical protein